MQVIDIPNWCSGYQANAWYGKHGYNNSLGTAWDTKQVFDLPIIFFSYEHMLYKANKCSTHQIPLAAIPQARAEPQTRAILLPLRPSCRLGCVPGSVGQRTVFLPPNYLITLE